MIRLTIDPEVCQGHGRCYMLAPELFKPDDDGHGEVVLSEVPADLEAKARTAESNCPEQAITISSS